MYNTAKFQLFKVYYLYKKLNAIKIYTLKKAPFPLTWGTAWRGWRFWGTKGVKGSGVKLEGGSSGRGPRGDGSGFGTAKIFKKD